jgi:3-oxoadipate enol-lactonase
MRIELSVNGRSITADVGPADLLLDVLRAQGRCLSVREGCGVGVCGTCTALVDGIALSTCLALAARYDGAEVLTVEGLPAADPVVDAFVEEGAMQCGYCSPGFVLMVRSLLDADPQPDPEAVEACLASNVCRCGAYPEIERAVVRTAAVNRARRAAPSDVLVSAGDVRIAAQRRGSGEPVVLLHSLAMSGAMWAPLASRLAERFEVWTYDARGHGATTGGLEHVSIENMAEDLVALLDGIGLERASILGASMGGRAAIVFAARYPQRVGRLVLADTTACYGTTRAADWAQRAERALGVPREDQLPFQLERWFSPAFRAEQPAEVRRLSEIFVSTDSHAHAAACRALGQFDAVPDLGEISAETLVLVGSDDTATPVAMAEQLAASIGAATLQVIPDAAHLAVIEKPDTWKRIDAFLAGEA